MPYVHLFGQSAGLQNLTDAVGQTLYDIEGTLPASKAELRKESVENAELQKEIDILKKVSSHA